VVCPLLSYPGGKFANGAMTAAMGYLFNQLMSKQAREQAVRAGPCASPTLACAQQNTAFNEAVRAGTDSIERVCPECYLAGWGGAIKGLFGLTESFAAKTPSLIDALANAVPVGSALKTDAAHVAGSFFRREALETGAWSTRVGGDGVSRISVELQVTGARIEYMYQRYPLGWEMTHQFVKTIK
jgi:hypothetical protein